nr:hyp [Cotesia vestalis bracovirus]
MAIRIWGVKIVSICENDAWQTTKNKQNLIYQ